MTTGDEGRPVAFAVPALSRVHASSRRGSIVENAPAQLNGLDSAWVRGLRFESRRWSFTAQGGQTGNLFVKVPKGRPDSSLEEALGGTEEAQLVDAEFRALIDLAIASDPKVRTILPVGIVPSTNALVVAFEPHLTPLETILRGKPAAWARPLWNIGEWLGRVHRRFPGKVVAGLDVGNMAVDASGTVVVFDPNELKPGQPDHDVAGFVSSLLVRGFERGRLPPSSAVTQVLAFVDGYGDVTPLPDLARSVDAWTTRLRQEIRDAGRRRFHGPRGIGFSVWFGLYARTLAERTKVVKRKLAEPVAGADSPERYGTDEAAKEYRRQQTGIGVGNARLALLTVAEIAAVRRGLHMLGPCSTALDVPAGTGRLWSMLRAEGLQVMAGDASPAMLRSAPTIDGISREVMDAEAIPYPEDRFDVVVCLRLLHRTPRVQRVRILRELNRVSVRGVVGSIAEVGGTRGLRYALKCRLAGSSLWAPFPMTRRELEAQLALAGLDLVATLPVAGILSNETVFVARGSVTSDVLARGRRTGSEHGNSEEHRRQQS